MQTIHCFPVNYSSYYVPFHHLTLLGATYHCVVYFALMGANYHFYFAFLGANPHFHFAYLDVIYYYLYLSLLSATYCSDNALLSVNNYLYFALLSATCNFALLSATCYLVLLSATCYFALVSVNYYFYFALLSVNYLNFALLSATCNFALLGATYNFLFGFHLKYIDYCFDYPFSERIYAYPSKDAFSSCLTSYGKHETLL